MIAELLPWLAVILVAAVQLLRERSYREAKEAQLASKDEHIALLRATTEQLDRASAERVATLQATIERLERFSLPRVDEYFASQQRILEGQIERIQQQARESEAVLRIALEEKERELTILQIEGRASASEAASLAAERQQLSERVQEMEERIANLAEMRADLNEEWLHWIHDRQDAQTKLHGYRERASELLEQIRQIGEAGPEGKCPTCQRPLGADFERMLAELEEQQLLVVQDGKWWRQRREELEAAEPTPEQFPSTGVE